MTNQITFMVAVVVLLVGCSQHPAVRPAIIVPEKELSAFLEQTKTGDFHDLSRVGEALLKPGLRIVDYKTKLKDFPSGILKEGQVRYELMSFHGDGGAGGINLFLNADTGEIIQFLPFDATF